MTTECGVGRGRLCQDKAASPLDWPLDFMNFEHVTYPMPLGDQEVPRRLHDSQGIQWQGPGRMAQRLRGVGP